MKQPPIKPDDGVVVCCSPRNKKLEINQIYAGDVLLPFLPFNGNVVLNIDSYNNNAKVAAAAKGRLEGRRVLCCHLSAFSARVSAAAGPNGRPRRGRPFGRATEMGPKILLPEDPSARAFSVFRRMNQSWERNLVEFKSRSRKGKVLSGR